MKKDSQNRKFLPALALILMLLDADLDKQHSYDFYVLLRLLAFVVFSYFAFCGYKKHKIHWAWIYGGAALAYNPFLPIHLTRETWEHVDMAAMALAYFSFIVTIDLPS